MKEDQHDSDRGWYTPNSSAVSDVPATDPLGSRPSRGIKRFIILFSVAVLVCAVAAVAIYLLTRPPSDSRILNEVVRFELEEAQRAARGYYGYHGSYEGVCSPADRERGIYLLIESTLSHTVNLSDRSVSEFCQDREEGWMTAVPISGRGASRWCVDHLGYSGVIEGSRDGALLRGEATNCRVEDR